MVASVIIHGSSNWSFSDSFEEDWYSPSFDDSEWRRKRYGDFPPYEGSRFYRMRSNVSCEALQHSGAIMFALHGRNYSSLYANGYTIYRALWALSLSVTPRDTFVPESEDDFGYFLFSIAPSSVLRRCVDAVVPFVVAATSTSASSAEQRDFFDMSVFLVPETSVRTGDSTLSSRHGKDFFKNPIALATDNNRFTGWKARGFFADFTMTLNHRRYEYLNAYRVTCGEEASSRPSSWIVRGCVENWDGWGCEILDSRDRVQWAGTATTVEFAMNALGKPYRRFSIDFRSPAGGCSRAESTSDGREVFISEIGFLARAAAPMRELRYPASTLSALVGQTNVYLQPLSPGFTDFSVDPEFPKSLRLESLSGVVTGVVAEPGKERFTITAKQAVTLEDANTTLTITSEGGGGLSR